MDDGLGQRGPTAPSTPQGRAGHDSWVTLSSTATAMSHELHAAIEAFDAGDRPAAVAAARWLKTEARRAFPTARTRVILIEGHVAGFYALASAHVSLSQHDRRSLGVEPVRVPAALVAWIAKGIRTSVDGKTLLLHAAAVARRVGALQATTVLVVDPFDSETEMMWRQRFGFRRSVEAGTGRRLWLPLV